MVFLIYTSLAFEKVSPLGLEIASLKRLRYSDGKKYHCPMPKVIVTDVINFAEQMAYAGAWLVILCIKKPYDIHQYPTLYNACTLDIGLGELDLIEQLKMDNQCQSPISHYQRELILFANEILQKINEIQKRFSGLLENRSNVRYVPQITILDETSSYTDCERAYPKVKKEII